jgi:hypothetical protein
VFGLEFIAAGLLYFSPPPSVQEVFWKKECDAKPLPKITLSPSRSRVKYNFTKTKAELNNIDVDTVSPYGAQHKTTVSGLMSGALQIEQQVGLISETYRPFSYGCVYINSIDVKINIEPVVYIAKEHPQGSCMHNAVLIHERKHVKEDQLIINKYVSLIDVALHKTIKTLGSTHGPVDEERIPYVQKNLQETLNKVIIDYSDQMNEERRRRQQAIDNVEEYDEVGRRCRDR